MFTTADLIESEQLAGRQQAGVDNILCLLFTNVLRAVDGGTRKGHETYSVSVRMSRRSLIRVLTGSCGLQDTEGSNELHERVDPV